jgi:hypothetical protein
MVKKKDKKDDNKENQTGAEDKKRARWNKLCDSILIRSSSHRRQQETRPTTPADTHLHGLPAPQT